MPSWSGSNVANASLSMIVSGRARPPTPTTVGAGIVFPPGAGGRTVVVGVTISVSVRFVLDAPPARNSETVPLTRTASPTLTAVGADDVKTRMPSDVLAFVSGFGAWM